MHFKNYFLKHLFECYSQSDYKKQIMQYILCFRYLIYKCIQYDMKYNGTPLCIMKIWIIFIQNLNAPRNCACGHIQDKISNANIQNLIRRKHEYIQKQNYYVNFNWQ